MSRYLREFNGPWSRLSSVLRRYDSLLAFVLNMRNLGFIHFYLPAMFMNGTCLASCQLFETHSQNDQYACFVACTDVEVSDVSGDRTHAAGVFTLYNHTLLSYEGADGYNPVFLRHAFNETYFAFLTDRVAAPVTYRTLWLLVTFNSSLEELDSNVHKIAAAAAQVTNDAFTTSANFVDVFASDAFKQSLGAFLSFSNASSSWPLERLDNDPNLLIIPTFNTPTIVCGMCK
jgi:hypothetical protein